MPSLQVLPGASLDGASGAFSNDTGTIYLSQDYLNVASSTGISSIFLHEIGHFVQSQVIASSTEGEVGAMDISRKKFTQ